MAGVLFRQDALDDAWLRGRYDERGANCYAQLFLSNKFAKNLFII
jgi:hypothetical protein